MNVAMTYAMIPPSKGDTCRDKCKMLDCEHQRSQLSPARTTTPSCSILISTTRNGQVLIAGSRQPGTKRSSTKQHAKTQSIKVSMMACPRFVSFLFNRLRAGVVDVD